MTPHEILRKIRKSRGLTEEQLANRIGTSQQQINRLENGGRRITVEWMVLLAKGLGCAPADFFGESGQSAAPTLDEELYQSAKKYVDAALREHSARLSHSQYADYVAEVYKMLLEQRENLDPVSVGMRTLKLIQGGKQG